MADTVTGLRCISADWTYDGGDVTISVPDGYMVLQVILNIQTTLNGVAPGTVSVGKTAATAAFIAATSAAGYYRASEGVAANADGLKLTTEDVIVDVTINDAVQGAGEVYVLVAPVVA